VRLLAGLPEADLAALESLAEEVTASRGENLLVEGAPARYAFVVRSGHLSVRLETASGAPRIVRCTFPGDVLGESSVLGGLDATCTATVQAECITSLWRWEGAELRALCAKAPLIRARLDAARTRHRLDSFFSMHEDAPSLDARVRDRLLGCITSLKRAAAGEVLVVAGAPPPFVFLVIEGEVEVRKPDQEPRRYRRDTFVGLHDALHELAFEGQALAATPCRRVVFDGVRLRKLAAEAPPAVADAIERLGR